MVVSVQHKITGAVKTYPDAEKVEVTGSIINITKGRAYVYSATNSNSAYDITYSRKYWQLLGKEA